jgi:DNA-binding NtrC family response regulator
MTSVKGKRVLLVEDDPVVAMVVEDTLRDMGLEVAVDLSLVDALGDVESGEFDAAVIDVGLRGENAHAVMIALQAQSVPFMVMSGGDLATLATEFPRVRMMSKPLDMNSLQEVMRGLLGQSPADRPV